MKNELSQKTSLIIKLREDLETRVKKIIALKAEIKKY
jgi:hypothetical protein